MEFQSSVTVALPFTEAVIATRAALTARGFDILTAIDMRSIVRDRLGVEMEPYLILGVCIPYLAYQALQVDRRVGVMMPRNVVIRSSGSGGCTVQILDAELVASVSEMAGVQHLVDAATARLRAALRSLSER